MKARRNISDPARMPNSEHDRERFNDGKAYSERREGSDYSGNREWDARPVAHSPAKMMEIRSVIMPGLSSPA
jgi:hypothetical protein